MNSRKLLAAAMSAFLVLGASALPAQAAKAPKTYNFKVTGTISGANGKTVLLLADTGRVLGSQSIVKSKQALSITSSQKTSNLSGATLQLVTTSGGDYYGPVVLGWKSKTKVYTQFGTKASSKGKYKVGTIVVSSASASGLQGYGKVKKKLTVVKKNVVAATNYKPAGVGNYGKTGGAAVSLLGNARGFIGSGPIGDIDLRNVIAEDKKFDGGDADGDGLPNVFDVNDDGDAILDQADSNSPAPSAGANCQAGASFNVFTNFKSTQTNMQGNINAYGTGDATSSDAKIASALTNTLSIVMAPITSVCGSNVIKSEFRGVGTLPYAPSAYVDITAVPLSGPGTTGDYQWTVGNGKVGNTAIAGLAPFTFTAPNQISGQDVLMQRVTTADGNVYEFAGTMGFVFVTHPLPLRYSTDNGTSWSNFTFSGGVASYGTAQKIALANNTKLTVEFAVPQRLAFDGEGGSYWDLGNMTYSPDAPNAFGAPGGPGKCDSQAATDATADTAVAASPRVFQLGFTLGTCFSDKGKAWGTSGQELQGGVDIQVVPAGGGGNSAQKLGISAQ